MLINYIWLVLDEEGLINFWTTWSRIKRTIYIYIYIYIYICVCVCVCVKKKINKIYFINLFSLEVKKIIL